MGCLGTAIGEELKYGRRYSKKLGNGIERIKVLIGMNRGNLLL